MVSSISTPPCSDGILSASEETEPSTSQHIDTLRKETPIPSVSSVNKPANPTPSKSAVILVNRLTDQDLRLHGVRESSISPTDHSRPKKRPRLHSPPINSTSGESSLSVNRENRISKNADNRPNGTRKVAELFGDDSDDSDASPAQRREVSSSHKSPAFNPDALDYDFAEEEHNTPSRSCNESNVESQSQNKKNSETEHRSKSSKSSRKEKSSEKEKRSSKDKKKKSDEKSKSSEKGTKSSDKSRNKESKVRKEKEKENQAASGTSNKFRIPKIANPSSLTSLNAGQSVGLPFLLQQNLEQNLKGAAQPASIEEGLPSRLQSSSANERDSIACPDNAAPSSTVLSERSDTPVEPTPSTAPKETFQLSAEAAPRILCVVPSKKERAKSVVFSADLEKTRIISPRSDEVEGTPKNVEIPSSTLPQELIKNYFVELEYEPRSSPRPVTLTGCRPL